jgi:hypothetical protein
LLTPQIVAREATIFGCSLSNNRFTNQSCANVCVCGVKKSVELDFRELAVRGGRLTLQKSRPTGKIDYRPWVTASAFLA